MKVGIDLGGSHIAIGVINNENKIVEQYEKDFTQEDKNRILEVVEIYIADIVNKLSQKYDFNEIGIAIPGVAKDGIILKTVNLGINNYNIAEKIYNKTGKNVTVRNDAKCACLAEYDNLVKKDKNFKNRNILFLTIGTGIGGGVIYDGKLLEGSKFEGFELGHTTIKFDGIPCKCGRRGCFERYGSILEFKNKIKERLSLEQSCNRDELREIMKQRMNEIEDIMEEYKLNLAIGISNLINIFEPDTVILGGGFTHFAYMFGDDIKNKIVNSELLFNRRDDIDLKIAELGNDAGIIGATLKN